MKRFQWLIPIMVVALMWLSIPLGLVFAATTADVTINATPTYISITVNNTTFDFSTVAASSTENTTAGYFGITNVSTVSTDNTIVSNGWQDTDGGSNNPWTWGNAAEDTAEMNASDGDAAYDVVVDDSTPASLKVGVGATTDWVFELELEAPSSFTFGDAQGTTITVSASAS